MIGGNIIAAIEVKTTDVNEIGEPISIWNTVDIISGFLDLMAGDSKYLTFSAKLQESTHVFICDYKHIDAKPSNSRMVINNKVYDILLIDDPMELHQHLEIFLKYTGE